MSTVFENLQGQQFINLTTYRKSGEPVVTTVWFAHEGDRIVGTTQQQAGKLKRMRGTPRVSLAPSTFNGQVLGEAVDGIGRVLPAEESAAAEAALRGKYGARYDEVTANSDRATRVFWEVKPVMNHPFLDTLFAYDRWATRTILEACVELTQEEFEQPLHIGLGSLERTLTHLVSTQFFFADRLDRHVPRPRLEKDGRTKTAAELLELFTQADREFNAAISRTIETHALTDILNWTATDDGPIDPENQVPYALALAQMIDHGIQHRTQAADMLELLGKGLPLALSPFEWDEARHSQA